MSSARSAFVASLILLAAAPVAAETITVYSAGPANLIEPLAAGFTKQTGITIGLFQETTGKIMARLESEAANPVADVLISASTDSAIDLDRRGMLLAYASPNAEKVPDFLKRPTYVTQGISALGIVWNASSKTRRPADWSDLAAPDFKNGVTLPDPAESGATFELVQSLANRNGGAGWSFFEQLKANGAVVAGANAAALNPVLQGAKSAVFGAVDYIALDRKAAGETVEVIFPTSGTVIAPRPMMIFKSSKHPEEAKKFIDYSLSPEGQGFVAKVYLMPARTDVKADRPLISDLALLPASDGEAAGRKATLDRFNQIFGRK
jgi:iron(III) transport system substrate-binding protein